MHDVVDTASHNSHSPITAAELRDEKVDEVVVVKKELRQDSKKADD